LGVRLLRLLWGRNPGELEIVVFLMAERIKAPHRKAGIFQRQRQRWQVRLGTKKGNSFLMEGKWGHPISLQSLLLSSETFSAPILFDLVGKVEKISAVTRKGLWCRII